MKPLWWTYDDGLSTERERALARLWFRVYANNIEDYSKTEQYTYEAFIRSRGPARARLARLIEAKRVFDLYQIVTIYERMSRGGHEGD